MTLTLFFCGELVYVPIKKSTSQFCPSMWIIETLTLIKVKNKNNKLTLLFILFPPKSCHIQHGVRLWVGDWWLTPSLQEKTKPNHQWAQINLIASETSPHFLPPCFMFPAPLCVCLASCPSPSFSLNFRSLYSFLLVPLPEYHLFLLHTNQLLPISVMFSSFKLFFSFCVIHSKPFLLVECHLVNI